MKKNERILFLGNGMCRAYSGDSWSDIISDLQKKYKSKYEYKWIKELPFNMQVISATNDHVNEAMGLIAKEMCDMKYSCDMKEFVSTYIADLPIEDIITTNYTYELETALCGEYSCSPNNRGRKKVVRKKAINDKFMINRYNDVEDKRIWHIHGELCSPKTIVMGNYYYGKMLYTIQEYVTNRMSYIKFCERREIPIKNPNWIDLFLTRDVYVVGFGMDFSEYDFWWLACCKKRNFESTKIYVYEPNMRKEDPRRIMAECYGIELVDVDRCVGKREYQQYYKDVFNRIKNR